MFAHAGVLLRSFWRAPRMSSAFTVLTASAATCVCVSQPPLSSTCHATPRRLCHTPYGDGIIVSVGHGSGLCIVSLNWGASLYCPLSFVGVTEEQILEMGRQEHQELVQQRSARRRLSTSEFEYVPPTKASASAASTTAAAAAGASATAGATATAGETQLPFNSGRVVTQCIVQLELIATVALLTETYLDRLTTENIVSLLTLLEGSAAFARMFNNDKCVPLPWALAGFVVVSMLLLSRACCRACWYALSRAGGFTTCLCHYLSQAAAGGALEGGLHAVRASEQAAVAATPGDERDAAHHQRGRAAVPSRVVAGRRSLRS